MHQNTLRQWCNVDKNTKQLDETTLMMIVQYGIYIQDICDFMCARFRYNYDDGISIGTHAAAVSHIWSVVCAQT